jgi:hypothetical protein
MPVPPEHRLLREKFLEDTGYGSHDLLSLNYQTRIFLTMNGGKYRVETDGSIEHLGGPPPDVADRFLN